MADATRVLWRTSSTHSETFAPGGTPTDLDNAALPTVTITRPDGTTIAPGTITRLSAGVYQFVLGPQPELTVLTVDWTGMIGGYAQTLRSTIEVVGAWLFNLAALRALTVGTSQPFKDQVTYPDRVLVDRRDEVTSDFEQRTSRSFIPRYTRERHAFAGRLLVDQVPAGRLLSLAVDGVAQSISGLELDSVTGELFSTLYGTWPWPTWGAGWARGQRVTVEYVRGDDPTPPAISSAGMARAAMLLLPALSMSTASSWTTPDGTTYSYDQAGQPIPGGVGIRHYGVAAIDSVLNAYSARGPLVG